MADKANGVQRFDWATDEDGFDLPAQLRGLGESLAQKGWNSDDVMLHHAADQLEALEAKLEAAERDAARWRWTSQRAWFVDAGAYAFDLRFGPGDFSTEPRNADADDVQQAIDEAMAEDSELDTAIDAAIDAQRQEGK